MMRMRRWLTAVGLLTMLTAGCDILPDGTAVRGTTLFSEQFERGQTGNWYTETDTAGQTTVLDGALIIEIDEPNTVQYSALQEPQFSDFVLEVDVTQLSGGLRSSHGVLFRLVGDVFYRFEITGDGLYVIEKQTSAGWERLTEDWPESPAIVTGLNELNRLRVEAVGTQMTFYINDQLVNQIVDGSHTSGRIALSAGTFNQGGVRVAFDNLSVRQP